MAQQPVNVGAAPNDDTGDPLRNAFIKLNANDTELYASLHSHANQAILDAITASYTTAEETKLAGIETGATADQTDAEIKTAYENNANTNAYTDAEKTKLAGIATGAEVNAVDSVNTQTGAVVLDADDISDAATTNKFTTAADISKLAGIENNATADQTDAEIKTAYENNANTNAFTDAEQTKLGGIETGADVTDAANVAAAGALMDGDFTANGTMERTGAGGYTTILNKRDATTAPTANDDSGDGYVVGSRWIDLTNDKEYVCVDNTLAAAVWADTTGSGGGAGSDTTAIHDDTAGEINAITEKASPTTGDWLIIEDGADSNNKKKVNVANLPTGGGGEANTASDGGTGGVGITLTKSGVNLPFKNMIAGSAKLSVTNDAVNSNVKFDLGSVASTDLTDGSSLYKSGGTDVPVLDGGTGASDAATARTNLGLQIGTNVQAHSAVLDATTASFTTTDETKLDGIEASADVTDTANVDAAGAVMDTDFASQGIMLRGATSGSYSITANNTANWDTAYSHSQSPHADPDLVLKKDGTVALTANWDAGAFSITAASFITNTISEETAAAGVTIDGLLIKDAGIPQAAVTAHEAALSITESQVSNLGTAVTLNADTDVSANSWVLDEDAMGSNDATKVPTQQSVKAYVDTLMNKHRSKALVIAVGDETTALTTGTAKVTFRIPFAFTLTNVRASVTTAPTTSDIIVDINEGGTSIFTTNLLHIDAGSKTSVGSATTPNRTDSSLADDAEMTIDIDQIGSGTAGAGLKVYLIGYIT